MKKRKICFIITSRTHYYRSKLILGELQKRKDVQLQIVVGGSAVLPNYGEVLASMEKDGFFCDEKIFMTVEGGNPVAMAKTAGLATIDFVASFDNLRPDLVVIRADRYELLSVAIAAVYLNIPLAHIEGGDTSGTIDESVRHALTKLSHIHFVTNDISRRRILRMGEDPKYVFDFGAPDLEFVAKNRFRVSSEFINRIGVGDMVNLRKPYLIVIQHPVTTEVGKNRQNIEETLKAVHKLGIPAIWFWPNIDAGTDEISKALRVFRENENAKHMRFLKDLPAEEFIGLLKKCVCLVGNSSAGIKECSLLGVPVVNIGTRQHGRMKAHNVMDVAYEKTEIKKAILRQVRHGKYSPSKIYYKPGSARNIVNVLATAKLYVQKQFHD